MSRTVRNYDHDGWCGYTPGRDGTGKACGWEYWSRRPCRGWSPSKDAKTITHQIERAHRRQYLYLIEYKDDDKAYAELKAVAS